MTPCGFTLCATSYRSTTSSIDKSAARVRTATSSPGRKRLLF
jgi:hypothetical protein